jgi:haloalkane dehalogenase
VCRVRTPEARFRDLPDYPFAPHYVDLDGMRLHYVDEGTGAPVLLLHGEPTWSFLYRRVIPPLVRAGARAVAPDYLGFGKS